MVFYLAFPQAKYASSNCSDICQTLVLLFLQVFPNYNLCCGIPVFFNLLFPKEYRCWASLGVLLSHPYILLVKFLVFTYLESLRLHRKRRLPLPTLSPFTILVFRMEAHEAHGGPRRRAYREYKLFFGLQLLLGDH